MDSAGSGTSAPGPLARPPAAAAPGLPRASYRCSPTTLTVLTAREVGPLRLVRWPGPCRPWASAGLLPLLAYNSNGPDPLCCKHSREPPARRPQEQLPHLACRVSGWSVLCIDPGVVFTRCWSWQRGRGSREEHVIPVRLPPSWRATPATHAAACHHSRCHQGCHLQPAATAAATTRAACHHSR